MKRQKKNRPKSHTDTAMERIGVLFGRAEKESISNPARSRRYLELAAKIAMRYNIRMPKTLKRRFCKECYTYMVPGSSCRVRTSSGFVSVTCLNCGKVSRYHAERRKNGHA